MNHSDVWIGELVRCLAALAPDTAREEALIAEVLGFQVGKQASDQPVLALPARRTTAAPQAPAAATPQRADMPAPLEVGIRVVRSRDVSVRADEQPWRRSAIELPVEQPSHIGFEPRHEALFKAGWTRALLSTLCATAVRQGPLDIAALVARIALGHPLTELPRQPRFTLQKGIQLLIDDADSMMSFTRDVSELADRIVEVVGRDRTSLLRFEEHPERDTEYGVSSYRLPPPGTPVLVLSDFGLGRSGTRRAATIGAWLSLAARLESMQCPMLAIAPVPYPRLPRALVARVQVVSWDRRTSVADVRRAEKRERRW